MTTMATRLPTKLRMTTAELRKELAAPKRSKYGNKPVTIDGQRFASQAEARRYQYLRLQERADMIEHLKTQRIFDLEGANGIKVCTYVADFVYHDMTLNRWIVEDVKGVLTPLFKLKAKLFRAQFGYDITLVR